MYEFCPVQSLTIKNGLWPPNRCQ